MDDRLTLHVSPGPDMSNKQNENAQDRREFSRTLAVGAALAATTAGHAGDEGDPIPQRPLGKTGVKVSALGLGGYHIGKCASLKEAVRIVHEAIDAGVTFMDNAWEYNGGRSEEWMGEALKNRRDKVFLMTKVCTHGRDKKVAMRQLEESLRRLQTDHLDLWQIHEVIYENDPDLHFARNGVIEALDEAKKMGKVRFVGFTGHKHPDIHLKMLSHDYPFDSVQMPLNCFDSSYRSFERRVLQEAIKKGIAVLGMKSLGGDAQPVLHGVVMAEEAIRYAMSLPVAVTITGVDSLEILRQNLAIARGFKPMAQAEMDSLRERCAASAGDGHLELYKSTTKYDGDVGREQHGYPSQESLPL
jgi:aryl-alcohol dehydrogenase-like predicted oxidoreductase